MLVEAADDGRDVRLEEPVAHRDQRQSREHDGERQRIALAARLQRAFRQVLGFLPIIQQRDGPVLIASDLQLLALVDDEARLARVAGRPVDEMVDDDFVAVALNDRVGLCRSAPEGERKIANRHHDCAELHRALGAKILVSQQAADQRG